MDLSKPEKQGVVPASASAYLDPHYCVRMLSEIKVLEADMLDLPFDDGCFDVVIEKGTMDVLFVDSGDPWNPKPVTTKKVMAMLEGVHRVLKPHGIFISITFGQGKIIK